MHIKSLLKNNPLIVITGPTASGKTRVSIELSKYLDIEIISADSRQIYKYLDIGTAKPTKEELALVKHYFIDLINPDEYFSAGLFGLQAKKIALEILKRNKIPIVVGGSGLYVKALCEGLFKEEKNISYINQKEIFKKIYINKSKEELYYQLLQVDPDSAKKYQDKNPRRLMRALEFYHVYGYPISIAQKNNLEPAIFNTMYFGINIERNILYEKINKRCEKMWEDGLINETEKILKMGYSPYLNSLNTVGYKEAIAYLDGKLKQSEALSLMKQNTRHYAKRQLTWFKKNENIVWLEGSYQEIATKIARTKLI